MTAQSISQDDIDAMKLLEGEWVELTLLGAPAFHCRLLQVHADFITYNYLPYQSANSAKLKKVVRCVAAPDVEATQ